MSTLIPVHAIVLRTTPVGEKDLVVHLLTDSCSKIVAFARGARGSSKFTFDIFEMVRVELVGRSSGMPKVRGLFRERSFKSLQEDLDKLTICSLLVEAFDRLIPEETDPNPELYTSLSLGLSAIDEERELKHILRCCHLTIIGLLENIGLGVSTELRAPSLKHLITLISRIEDQLSGPLLSGDVLKHQIFSKLLKQEKAEENY